MDTTKRNRDGQPLNRSFNMKRNRSKTASSLLGILEGIACDKELNDIEIFFLKVWIESQNKDEGDFKDILECVNEVLEDGIIDDEERAELNNLLNDCIEYSEKDSSSDARIDELVGFLEGIASDDVINVDEFNSLKTMVNSVNDILEWFPLDEIKKQIEIIMDDGKVEKSELIELCDLIKDITGQRFTSDGNAVGGATTLFNEPIPEIAEKYICLTGKFTNGTRNAMQELLIKYGAHSQNKVTKETDILVIGTLSSKDWIHTSCGRKIERAIDYRKKGQEIIISSERVLMEYICNTPFFKSKK